MFGKSWAGLTQRPLRSKVAGFSLPMNPPLDRGCVAKTSRSSFAWLGALQGFHWLTVWTRCGWSPTQPRSGSRAHGAIKVRGNLSLGERAGERASVGQLCSSDPTHSIPVTVIPRTIPLMEMKIGLYLLIPKYVPIMGDMRPANSLLKCRHSLT